MSESENMTARDLLTELDLPVATGRRQEILDALAAALQPLYRLVITARRRQGADGSLTFAMLHLATRSLSDLLTAVHLASHAYLQQAYGALRPVYENCDLIELLARDSAEAAAWITTDKPWTEFAPGAVRRRLGALPDPVYSHVTEMGTHPRFAGSRLTGVMEVARDDAAMRTAVLRVGCFFPEHPASVLVYTFLFDGVVRLGFKLRHLTQVSRETSHDAWCDALLESTIAVRRGCSLIRAELVDIDGGEGSEFLEAAYVEVVEGLQPGGQLRTGHP